MLNSNTTKTKLINNHVLITKRQIIIEKYTKPNYIEKTPRLNRNLFIWLDESGFYHRDNNLPAAVVIDKDKTTINFYKHGYITHQITYDNLGNETSIDTREELINRYDALGLIIEPMKLNVH